MVNKYPSLVTISYLLSVSLFASLLVKTASAKVNNQVTISAPLADLTSTPEYSIPLSWGVMDPNILVDSEENWYSTLWYPCNDADKKVYCLKIVKNGTLQSSEYRLDTYRGQGNIIQAYQSPILFQTDPNTVQLAHWAITDQQKNLVIVASISILQSGFGASWHVNGTLSQPSSYNYLGGAVGPGRELVIAGWSQSEGLLVTRSYPPYNAWEQTTTEAMGSRTALYSHVAVGSNSRIAVLSVDSQYTTPCSEVNQILTSYKNIHYYESDFANLRTALKLSDKAPDYINYHDYNPCAWRNMRYPLDLFYDAQGDRFFLIILKSDLNAPYFNYASNNGYTQSFHLHSSDNQVDIPDLSIYFKSLGLNGNDFDGFKITRIRSGEYAIVGSSISHQIISTIFTRDFKTFSNPQSLDLTTIPAYLNLDTSQASYIRPQVFQPNKNSIITTSPRQVHIWFSPYTYSQPNYWLRYTHFTVSSNLDTDSALIPLPGDLDGDGHINYVDFNLLITNFGNPYTIFDFNDIVSNYGN
jgi:hypothetical protein